MHSQLKQYLNEVEQGLQSLPAEQRRNELAELRGHLEAMAQANQELGQSEEEAYHAAIRQFGASQDVGTELATVQRAGGRKWGEIALYALGGGAVGETLARIVGPVFQAILAPGTFAGVSPGTVAPHAIPASQHHPVSVAVVTVTYLFVAPILLGFLSLAYLLYRNGWRRVVSTARRLQSPLAIAALWTATTHPLGTLASAIQCCAAVRQWEQWLDARFFHAGTNTAMSLAYMSLAAATVFVSGMLIGSLTRTTTRVKTIFEGIGTASATLFVTTVLFNLVRMVVSPTGDLSLSVYPLEHVSEMIAMVMAYSVVGFVVTMLGVLTVRRPQATAPRKLHA